MTAYPGLGLIGYFHYFLILFIYFIYLFESDQKIHMTKEY